ncbi:hypothetical protein I215_15265 [Galbibacter marinus]|uniref:Uncharacterized protein n=1 Tax=Galbibacter marinus TaxID=555500 RepID=K2PZ45_9FLAO|nr:hypothetical protein I215_15265 [Galbibacter marinus]
MIRIINNGATGAIINLRGYDREIYVFFLKSELYNGKYFPIVWLYWKIFNILLFKDAFNGKSEPLTFTRNYLWIIGLGNIKQNIAMEK